MAAPATTTSPASVKKSPAPAFGSHVLTAPSVQRKATSNSRDDPQEREADAVAERVMGTVAQAPIRTSPRDKVQRTCAECDQDKEALDAVKQGGEPLPVAAREQLSARFGHDFSRVRIHADAAAAEAARAISARAYTLGHHIVFGRGEYALDTSAGMRLMAHELTHVVQQAGGTERVQRLTAEQRDENLRSPRYAGNERLEAAFDNDPAMGIGESGDAVRRVQEGLVRDQLDMPVSIKPDGELDGIFGPETRQVVRKFQAKHGLDVDGLVGRQTMGRLDELALKVADEKAPPKFAEEEDALVCPSEEEIEELAADGGNAGVRSLFGAALGRNRTKDFSLTAAANAHVGIAEAVRRFKEKVNVAGVDEGDNLSRRGQFFWATQIRNAINSELTRMEKSSGTVAFVAKARAARDAIWNDQEELASSLLRELDQMAKASKSPEKPNMLALLLPDLRGGAGVQFTLWTALDASPTNVLPDLASFRSLRVLRSVNKVAKGSCGDHAIRVAQRLRKRGGITPRDPAAKPFSVRIASGGCMRDRRPTGFGGRLLGDQIFQANVADAVAKTQRALDAGLVVHARVLSGVGYGTAPEVNPDPNATPTRIEGGPPEEHSLLLIGYDGNQFVFNDPDAAVSSTPEAGFGKLFFDAANQRLTTADGLDDMPVSFKGKHLRGDKRYQVISLSTLP